MSSFQKFTVRTVKRSSIQLADYNPRVITEHAQKELRKKIKQVGLLSPLIWNKKTGRLVAGHQRISQLDALEGYPGKGDYDIQVSEVNLSEKVEKEMNVFLNNPSAQGEFDIDAIKGMLELGDIDLQEMGFEDSDIHVLFEDFDALGTIKDAMAPSEATGALEAIKDARAKAKEKLTQDNDADFYFVVVCRGPEEKQALLRHLSAEREDQQFVRSTALISALANIPADLLGE